MNKNTKKILIGSGITLGVVIPVVLAFTLTPRNVGIKVTETQAFNDLVESKNTAFEEANKQNDANLNKKTLLITAGGVVNDLSFNQSVWEALQTLGNQTGKPGNFSFTETTAGTPDQLQEQYRQALFFDHQYWVLTGFQQASAFQSWLEDENNKKQFIEKKIIVIAIDWTLDVSKVPPGQFISINYKTQEAAWEVGYAASKFISENYTNRKFNTFGGGPFPGVTNFNAGFLQGVLDFNKSTYTTDKPVAEANKLKFVPGEEVTLNTGFASTPSARTTIDAIVGADPQAVFPVAGSLTAVTVNSVNVRNQGKDDNEKQFVIGVDSDQSKAFSGDLSKLFFSSVEKNIAGTIYAALSSLYLGQTQTDPFFKVTNADGSTSQFVPVSETSKTPTNIDINKGFTTDSVNFVGSSSSNLSGSFTSGPNSGKTLKAVADEALDEAKTLFNANKDKIIGAIPPQGFGPGFEEIPTTLNTLIKEINGTGA